MRLIESQMSGSAQHEHLVRPLEGQWLLRVVRVAALELLIGEHLRDFIRVVAFLLLACARGLPPARRTPCCTGEPSAGRF